MEVLAQNLPHEPIMAYILLCVKNFLHNCEESFKRWNSLTYSGYFTTLINVHDLCTISLEVFTVRNATAKTKVYRPEIKDRSAEIVEMFVSRGYFRTQGEVVEAGLEMLLERALQEDSKVHREESAPMSNDLVKAQTE